MSLSQSEYQSRYGHRDALLAELSHALGVGVVRGVTVRHSRGPRAGWVLETPRGPAALRRSTLDHGPSLDSWRRSISGDQDLPALEDPRELIKSTLHRLSQYGN